MPSRGRLIRSLCHLWKHCSLLRDFLQICDAFGDRGHKTFPWVEAIWSIAIKALCTRAGLRQRTLFPLARFSERVHRNGSQVEMRKMMKFLAGGIGAVTLLFGSSAIAQVTVHINRATQTMSVSLDNAPFAVWNVSTARRGYLTPPGTYHPKRLERVWYSRKYDNAPMPFSIFFLGGYAIHGTTDIRNLGRPVSHGCVRLHPSNAATLFNLVRTRGRAATIIRVSSILSERVSTSIYA